MFKIHVMFSVDAT